MNRAPVDISKTEDQALKSASNDAGCYLEALGKADLVTMTKEEWREFIKVACFSYAENMRHTVEAEDIPYD